MSLVILTGHRTQLICALFSLQTVSLLPRRKLFRQTTHLQFLTAAPKTVTKCREKCGVNRFNKKVWGHLLPHRASTATANQQRSASTEFEDPRILSRNSSQNQQTLQVFSTPDIPLSHACKGIDIISTCHVSKMCAFYLVPGRLNH